MLTVRLWHDEGMEQERGRGKERASDRAREWARRLGSADTGKGNGSVSEPGDMTYEQTVGTLMGANSRGFQTRRDLAADSSGCSINLEFTAAAQQEDYSWPQAKQNRKNQNKTKKVSRGYIVMTAELYFSAYLWFLFKVNISWISLWNWQEWGSGTGQVSDEERSMIKHASWYIFFPTLIKIASMALTLWKSSSLLVIPVL